jgi:hypothetical protein
MKLQFGRTPFYVWLVIPLVLAAQTTSQTTRLRESVAGRIGSLSKSLRFRDAPGEQQYRTVKNQLTLQIHGMIDDYIAQAFDPAQSKATEIQEALTELLGEHKHDSQYSGPPFASLNELRNGFSLVVGYMLVRGGNAVNESAVSIRGYHAEAGQFRFSDSTGQDFDGYGLFVRQLASPVAGESWLFVWGPLSGFNGNKVRIRLYAFDGTKFRTVWDPGDVLNMTVDFSNDGFAVTHLDEDHYQNRRPPYYLRDDYVLTPDGALRASSQYVVK